MLKAHEKFGQSARRCVTALHILSSKILQTVPGGGNGNEGLSRRALAKAADGIGSGHFEAQPGETELPDLVQQLADEFAPIPELNQQDLAQFNIDVNDMAWLNDVQGVWQLLNE